MAASKVLVVEDEVDLRELLVHHLKREGFTVFSTGNGYESLQIARRENPQVMLLDLMLDGLDGLSVCHQLKTEHAPNGPGIIIVSARGAEEEVLAGLDRGADDYVRKPFNVKEVIARVKTLLRRSPAKANGESSAHILRFPPLVLDHARHDVVLAGSRLALTATEYRLLHLLMSSPERVFNRSQLLTQISDHKSSLSGRNIDVHIRSLRRKLGSHAAMIDTARGVGYRFNPAGAASSESTR